jgi:prepilin-type N-terminal cleavage/methylation domain-containing protein
MRLLRFQRGLSLIELMIGMVLGLVLMGGVITIFVGTAGTFALNRELDRSQENLRFVVTYLAQELRQAARIPDDGVNDPFPPVAVIADDEPEGTQTVIIRYPVVNFGEAVHCNGQPVAGDVWLEKSFSVDNGVLRCQSQTRVRTPAGDTLNIFDPVNVVSGVRRIRIEEWLESDVAPAAYDVESKLLSGLETEAGLGLVGVRLLVETDHVRGATQTFVVTVALRNTVLQWFTLRP